MSGDAIVSDVVQNIRLGGICKRFKDMFQEPAAVTRFFSAKRAPAKPMSRATAACPGWGSCAAELIHGS